MQNQLTNDQIPLSVDIKYLRKLEENTKRLEERNANLEKRIKEANETIFILQKELENFKLFLSYLVNMHGMVDGQRLFKFPDIFWAGDKLTDKILSEHGRYTIKKEIDGLVLVDTYSNYNEFSHL